MEQTPSVLGLSGPKPLLGSLPLDLPSMGVMAPLNRLAAKVLSTIVLGKLSGLSSVRFPEDGTMGNLWSHNSPPCLGHSVVAGPALVGHLKLNIEKTYLRPRVCCKASP